ncbi:hypothetical protein ANCDUO_15309 [Ancylostoma duodenale]|uniref:Uncharacterized protein n=1 Tax=Ancylostoma duodenale TaxID=51022 RepID=A0A0C2G6J8_9BILA|nr:hypothetical protein ANCDUO_15309 [Ancylostoma duodenale]
MQCSLRLQKSKPRGCVPLAAWREKVKTHLWKSIEDGKREQARHLFNTCLVHGGSDWALYGMCTVPWKDHRRIPFSNYKLYWKLATVHYNALTIAEITGEREKERVLEVRKKYLQRKSLLVFKTPIE